MFRCKSPSSRRRGAVKSRKFAVPGYTVQPHSLRPALRNCRPPSTRCCVFSSQPSSCRAAIPASCAGPETAPSLNGGRALHTVSWQHQRQAHAYMRQAGAVHSRQHPRGQSRGNIHPQQERFPAVHSAALCPAAYQAEDRYPSDCSAGRGRLYPAVVPAVEKMPVQSVR